MPKHLNFLALTGILIGAAIPANAQDDTLSRNWGAVEICASIANAGERHQCLDSELARMGLLAAPIEPTAPAQQTSSVSAAQTAAAPLAISQAIQAGPGSAIRPVPERTPLPAPMASGAIASVRLIGRSNIEIVADDGSRWRSTSSGTFRRTPRVGAPFSVEQGALGSYNCRIESSTYFKCEPIF